MNLKTLDKELLQIVEKRIELNALTYDDEQYDDLEEQLHDLEDDFSEKYGDYLEDALIDVHDEYCPDAEVLSPIAYLAKHYILTEEDGKEKLDVTHEQGVWIELEVGTRSLKEAYLVLLPTPTRLVLMSSKDDRKVVWKAK